MLINTNYQGIQPIILLMIHLYNSWTILIAFTVQGTNSSEDKNKTARQLFHEAPMPTGSLSLPGANYSGLMECPCRIIVYIIIILLYFYLDIHVYNNDNNCSPFSSYVAHLQVQLGLSRSLMVLIFKLKECATLVLLRRMIVSMLRVPWWKMWFLMYQRRLRLPQVVVMSWVTFRAMKFTLTVKNRHLWNVAPPLAGQYVPWVCISI